MNKIKEYWLLIVGVVATIAALLFVRKNGPDANTLKRAQDAELKVIDTKIESVEAKKESLQKEEAPKVADANSEQVNDFWKDKLQ